MEDYDRQCWRQDLRRISSVMLERWRRALVDENWRAMVLAEVNYVLAERGRASVVEEAARAAGG